MDLSGAKRLKQLEGENSKLKRLLADAMLDNVVLKDPLAVMTMALPQFWATCRRSNGFLEVAVMMLTG